MAVVGRFAPSPSGRMHLGNVFSALLAWLSVRAAGGRMILRIEDLDPDRCRPEYAAQLMDDLRWLGLTWDEAAPWQSTRTEVYRQMFARLEEKRLVYPCYCSRSALHGASAPHAADGRVLYAGTCRNMSAAQRAAQIRVPAWRLMVPDETICFVDGVQGEVAENLAQACGDFIIRRSDGVYAYQLAVATDDGLSGVTEVVRGRDLLDSTARQLYLYRLLDLPAPQFYHVPLLCAPDGRRLSKRERDLDMGALRERYTPQALIGLLGYWAGLLPDPQPMAPQVLAARFAWDRVRKEDIFVEQMPV